MAFPTRLEAEQFFEQVIARRNASAFPFLPQKENAYRTHCLAVAKHAEKIARFLAILKQHYDYFSHQCGTDLYDLLGIKNDLS